MCGASSGMGRRSARSTSPGFANPFSPSSSSQTTSTTIKDLSTETTPLNVGDEVLALWSGTYPGYHKGTCWYPGTIQKIDAQKGTYDIQWKGDSAVELNLTRNKIKVDEGTKNVLSEHAATPKSKEENRKWMN